MIPRPSRDLILSLVFALLCLGLLFVPTGFENGAGHDGVMRHPARVLEVDHSGPQILGLARALHRPHRRPRHAREMSASPHQA